MTVINHNKFKNKNALLTIIFIILSYTYEIVIKQLKPCKYLLFKLLKILRLWFIRIVI